MVNAHSLFLEALAELGPIGFLLICAFVIVALAAGARLAWRSTLGDRPELAAALGACCVFAAAAAVDWVWQLATIAAAFLVLAAVAVGGVANRTAPATAGTEARTSTWGRFAPAILTGALAVIALVAIAIPLASESAVEQSREQVADGDLDSALDSARNAVAIEPFASTPRIQEAATLELMGLIDEAAEAAREATTKEPANWRFWLVLSRLEARGRHAEASLRPSRRPNRSSPVEFPGPQEDRLLHVAVDLRILDRPGMERSGIGRYALEAIRALHRPARLAHAPCTRIAPTCSPAIPRSSSTARDGQPDPRSGGSRGCT